MIEAKVMILGSVILTNSQRLLLACALQEKWLRERLFFAGDGHTADRYQRDL
jgi:hypothetical protein